MKPNKIMAHSATVIFTGKTRNHHTHILGGTGTGKSKFLELLIRQDIMNNNAGFGLLDPHGNLYYEILSYVSHHAPHLAERFVLFDLANEKDHIMGFDPIPANAKQNIDFNVGQLIEALLKAWGQDRTDTTPRISKWLGNILYPIMMNGLTLVETLAFISTSKQYKPHREHLLYGIQNQLIHEDWTMYEASSHTQKQTLIEGCSNRLRKFIGNTHIRHLVGQQKHRLDLASIMDEGKIFLVNLNGGDQIPTESTRLIGIMLVNELFRVAKLRNPLDPNLKPYHLCIDEFASFITRDIARSLEECRKFKLFLSLAHQHLSQLKEEDEYLYASVMTNTHNKVVFGGISKDDANLMAEELFTGFLNMKAVKDSMYTTKVRHVEERRSVQTVSQSQSESHSETATKGQSTTEGTSKTRSEGKGVSISRGQSESIADGVSQSVSRSTTHGYSEGTGKTRGTTKGHTNGTSQTTSTGTSFTEGTSQSNGGSYSQTQGFSDTIGTAETRGKNTGKSQSASSGSSEARSMGSSNMGSSQTSNFESSGNNSQQSQTQGTTQTDSESKTNSHSHSSSTSETHGENWSHSASSSHGHSQGKSKGTQSSLSNSVSESDSEQYSISESHGRSVQKGISQTITKGNNMGINLSRNSSESKGLNFSKSDSTSQAKGATTGQVKGQSQAVVPFLKPVEYQELSSQSFWSLQESKEMAAAALKNQDVGEAILKIGNNTPVKTKIAFVTPVNHHPRLSERRIQLFKDRAFHSNAEYFASPEEIRHELQSRQKVSFPGLLPIQLDEGERPVEQPTNVIYLQKEEGGNKNESTAIFSD